MSIEINHPETERTLEELASRLGMGLDETIAVVVRERLQAEEALAEARSVAMSQLRNPSPPSLSDRAEIIFDQIGAFFVGGGRLALGIVIIFEYFPHIFDKIANAMGIKVAYLIVIVSLIISMLSSPFFFFDASVGMWRNWNEGTQGEISVAIGFGVMTFILGFCTFGVPLAVIVRLTMG